MYLHSCSSSPNGVLGTSRLQVVSCSVYTTLPTLHLQLHRHSTARSTLHRAQNFGSLRSQNLVLLYPIACRRYHNSTNSSKRERRSKIFVGIKHSLRNRQLFLTTAWLRPRYMASLIHPHQSRSALFSLAMYTPETTSVFPLRLPSGVFLECFDPMEASCRRCVAQEYLGCNIYGTEGNRSGSPHRKTRYASPAKIASYSKASTHSHSHLSRGDHTTYVPTVAHDNVHLLTPLCPTALVQYALPHFVADLHPQPSLRDLFFKHLPSVSKCGWRRRVGISC